jgi:transcriptional regulator with XRE-family HTH domain
MGVSTTGASGRELGAELRALRMSHGLNTRQMAERIGVSNANISHWETGTRLVPVDRLTAILDALAVGDDDRERLLGLRRQAEGPGQFVAGVPTIGRQLAQLIEYERTAKRITDVSPLVIPGLLQTSDYARAVLGDGPDTDTRVALRVGRRDVLTRKRNPVELVAFVDSEVLMRPLASPEVMFDQLEHLLKMAEYPNVTIQLVPSTRAGWHPMLAGPFILLEFPTATPIVHLEHYRASAFLWEEHDVAAFMTAPDEIRKRAMTPDRTSEVIREIAQGMETG